MVRTHPLFLAGGMVIALLASACTPDLPEPESPGAKLYLERCASCHRLYPPSVMTAATWDVVLKRMQGEMRRRGAPPLTSADNKSLLAYLSRHALDSNEPTQPHDPTR